MQVVILCGGKGTRLSEFTDSLPKPLVEIGNKPILRHLMELYAGHGHRDFILCLGYKGDRIKEHFKGSTPKDWSIIFADTGEDSNKAERLMRIKNRIKDDTFLVSYGDDLSDVDMDKLVKFHKKNGKVVTLTAVSLMSHFGIMELNKDNEVTQFKEKPKLNHWMNGGFYVFSRDIFNYLKSGHDLEKGAFEALAKEKKIAAFRHEGFWKSMNTLKDVIELNEMFERGEMPWIR